MKTLIQYIKIVLLTAVLFLAGLYLVDRIVTPEGEAEALYDEPKNSIDVLIVGGSQAMCSFSSTEIYAQTGLTVYNFSTWSQPAWVSYHYIKETLKYQKPKVVVVDVFGACYDRSYLTGVDVDLVSDDYAQLLKPSLNLLQLNLTRRRVQVTRKNWYEYLNIAKYHSRITELTGDSVAKLFRDDSTTGKGYGPFYTVEDFSGYVYPVSQDSIELYPYAAEYLEKIVELCRANDIVPVFTKLPHIADERDVALMNTIRGLAVEWSVDFLDFCSTNALGLDFSADFSDHGHLNNFGAKKATQALADHLNSLQLQSKHSDAIEQRWQAAYRIQKNEAAKMEIKLARSFDLFMSRVQQHEATAVIVVKQDGGSLKEKDYIALEELFCDTPFSTAVSVLRSECLFVYADGTVYTGSEAAAWCEANGVMTAADTQAQIRYGEADCSYGRDGLNVALLDTTAAQMYHYLSFAKEHDYLAYTR